MERSRRRVWIVLLVLLAAILLWKLIVIYTDWLWFSSPAIQLGSVFKTIYLARGALFAIFGLFFGGFVWVNCRLARRWPPRDVEYIGRRLLPPAERAQIEEYADRLLAGLSIIAGVVVGVVAGHRWMELLQYRHWTSFAQSGVQNHLDPIFGKDIGFYVFRLPFIEYVWQTAFRALIVALAAVVLVYIYEETIRFVGNRVQIAPLARTHVYSLAAAALLWKAIGYRLSMFETLYSTRGFAYGASYTEVHVHLPIYWFLMGVAVLAAGVVLWSIRRENVRIPGLAVAALLVFSFLGNVGAPAAVQRIAVVPTELEKEYQYLEYNIQYTRDAYNINIPEPDVVDFTPGDRVTRADLDRNPGTMRNIRLWDDRALEVTADQEQELRTYYDFPDVDIDRYRISGQLRQVMLSARQLSSKDIPPPAAQSEPTWVNLHLEYTHGYGIVMCPVSEVRGAGKPDWYIQDIPPRIASGAPQIDRAGLYFQALVRKHPQIPRPEPAAQPGQPGQPEAAPEQVLTAKSPDVARRETRPSQLPWSPNEFFIVRGEGVEELDYPDEPQNKSTVYSGEAGVQLSSFWRRLAFFLRFMDWQILFTGYLTDESRILFHTTVVDFAQSLAPFLLFDPDPYVVVADGKLKWLEDCYTFTRRYPYSEPDRVLPLNYIRNAVKVCIDAYHGTIDFYVADSQDPVIQTYAKIFPDMFRQTLDDMPEELRKHVRYPRGMFDIQAERYLLYHMTNPRDFYRREDLWALPNEVYGIGGGEGGTGSPASRQPLESYYVVMRLPQEPEAEFLVMMPFTPHGREDKNMIAWMAGRCDGDNYGTLRVYTFPKGALADGPMQIEAKIDADQKFSALQTLWGSQGSMVIRGNVLVLPIEDTILYVEPIYIQSSANPFPQLRQVIVADNRRLAAEPTLDQALAVLLGERAPSPAMEAAAGPLEELAPPEAAPPPEVTPPVPPPTGELSEEVRRLILQAEQHSREAEKLGQAGDYAGAAAEQEKLRQTLDELVRLTR
ncbi:MAG: UPF0182 family protein [Armatimonadota bacterium]